MPVVGVRTIIEFDILNWCNSCYFSEVTVAEYLYNMWLLPIDHFSGKKFFSTTLGRAISIWFCTEMSQDSSCI